MTAGKNKKNIYNSENKAAIVYPLAAAFLVPGLIGLFQPGLIQFFFILIFFALLTVVPSYVIFMTCYNWVNGTPFYKSLLTYLRPLPSQLPLGTDLKFKALPWATVFLIIINIVLHIFLPDSTKHSLAFPQAQYHSGLHIFMAFFLHAFVHGSNWHLIGNMIFLWVFGSTLEPRIGTSRFVLWYFACLVASLFFSCVLDGIRFQLTGVPVRGGIGASGAIAGIMGLFAVRCYFARVTVSLPFLFIPWLAVPIRVPALLLVCLFFAMNTAGSRAMLSDPSIYIDYWAHTGGYLFGFGIAFLLKYYKSAADESVSVKARRSESDPYAKKKTADIYQDIFQKDPENIEALRFFLEHYKYNDAKQPYIYGMLMRTLVAKDIKEATTLFDEYYPKYLNFIPGSTALKLGLHFYRKLSLTKARHCFQAAKDQTGPWQAKATLFLGKVFEDLGEIDLAQKYYGETRENFPGSDFAREARVRS